MQEGHASRQGHPPWEQKRHEEYCTFASGYFKVDAADNWVNDQEDVQGLAANENDEEQKDVYEGHAGPAVYEDDEGYEDDEDHEDDEDYENDEGYEDDGGYEYENVMPRAH